MNLGGANKPDFVLRNFDGDAAVGQYFFKDHPDFANQLHMNMRQLNHRESDWVILHEFGHARAHLANQLLPNIDGISHALEAHSDIFMEKALRSEVGSEAADYFKSKVKGKVSFHEGKFSKYWLEVTDKVQTAITRSEKVKNYNKFIEYYQKAVYYQMHGAVAEIETVLLQKFPGQTYEDLQAYTTVFQGVLNKPVAEVTPYELSLIQTHWDDFMDSSSVAGFIDEGFEGAIEVGVGEFLQKSTRDKIVQMLYSSPRIYADDVVKSLETLNQKYGAEFVEEFVERARASSEILGPKIAGEVLTTPRGPEILTDLLTMQELISEGRKVEVLQLLPKIEGYWTNDPLFKIPASTQVRKIGTDRLYGHDYSWTDSILKHAGHQDSINPIHVVKIGDDYMILDRSSRALLKGQSEINARVVQSYSSVNEMREIVEQYIHSPDLDQARRAMVAKEYLDSWEMGTNHLDKETLLANVLNNPGVVARFDLLQNFDRIDASKLSNYVGNVQYSGFMDE